MAALGHNEHGSGTRVTTEERFERIARGTERQLDQLGDRSWRPPHAIAHHTSAPARPISVSAMRTRASRRWFRLRASSCGTEEPMPGAISDLRGRRKSRLKRRLRARLRAPQSSMAATKGEPGYNCAR